jgi:hypothetical protein
MTPEEFIVENTHKLELVNYAAALGFIKEELEFQTQKEKFHQLINSSPLFD